MNTESDQNIFSLRINLLQKIGQSLPFELPKNKYYLNHKIESGLISFLKNTFYNKTNSLMYKLKDESNKIYLIEQENEGGKFTFIYNQTKNMPNSCVMVKLNKKITKKNNLKLYLYLEMAMQIFTEKKQEYSFYNDVDLYFEIKKTGIELKFYGFTKNIIICICNFFDVFLNIHFDGFSLAKKRGFTTFNRSSNKMPFVLFMIY